MVTSCSSFNQPISDTLGSNPLDTAGSTASSTPGSKPSTPPVTRHSPGVFLQTTSSNTPLFSKFPRSSDQPDSTLGNSTKVKVISSKGSYTKIETVKSGQVGYVPSVMLGKQRSSNEIAVIPGGSFVKEDSFIPDNSYVPEPLPTLLPEEAPAEIPAEIPENFTNVDDDLPFIAPEPENKGIEPPVIVDPLLPAE